MRYFELFLSLSNIWGENYKKFPCIPQKQYNYHEEVFLKLLDFDLFSSRKYFFCTFDFFSLSREYEKIYFELKHLTFKEIVAKTGCKKPCSYREYREVGKATRIFEYEESHKGLKLWIVGRERVSEVSNIYDFHHYRYGNFAHF